MHSYKEHYAIVKFFWFLLDVFKVDHALLNIFRFGIS